MVPSLWATPLPLAAAPMAGGPTTVALARAVGDAGAFAFLAAGYKTPDAMADEIEQLRDTGHPFGVNLFVPSHERVDAAAFRAYAALLQPEADRYGITLDPAPVDDDDHWPQKLAVLLERPVPVVSLTFGLPDPADIAALRRAGTVVLASVTTPDEALTAAATGVDGLVVQGPQAGGHSATSDPRRVITPGPTEGLVRSVRAACPLPVVAAGGVDGPDSVRRLLAAGAESVAVGTMFLLADEAGTSATHRAALRGDTHTATTLTHAFTGRPARALRNGFVDRYEDQAPYGYPAVHHLTRGLRQAAARAGDSDVLHLWAGTGWREARDVPAAAIVRWLCDGDAG